MISVRYETSTLKWGLYRTEIGEIIIPTTLMLPKPLIFLGLLISASACSPLVPLSYVDGSPDSQLTQSVETDEATVWLKYMKSQNGFMVFDLEIANHSLEEIQVAPQQVTFYASSKTFAPLQPWDDVHTSSAPNSKLTRSFHFAADPSSIRQFYVEKAKSAKVGAGIFAALAVGLILYDMAEDSKAATKEVSTSRDQWKSFGRDVMVFAAVTAKDVAQVSAQQAAEESHFLPYELFPECTIKAGSNVRGKIFLKNESSSHNYVRVVVPLGDTDYVFDFRRSSKKKQLTHGTSVDALSNDVVNGRTNIR